MPDLPDLPEDPQAQEWLESLDAIREGNVRDIATARGQTRKQPHVSHSPRRGRGSSRQSSAAEQTVPMPDPSALEFERGDHVELGRLLIERLQQSGPLVCADGAVFRYASHCGLWLPVDDVEQSRIVQTFAGAKVACDQKPLRIRASDVGGVMKLSRDSIADPDFFTNAPTGLAFANGFVEVSANGLLLRPHASEHKARAGFDFSFGAGTSAERWAEFLEQLFAKDDDRDEKISLLAEFAGAALLGIAVRFQRAVVLVGDGANGKSTFLAVVQSCMPAGTTAAIPPQDWGQEYRRAMLAGVRLNAVSELPEADILESEAFKATIDGSLMVGRRIRESPFSFRPHAAHLFAANRLPGTNDTTHGFWRRFIVVTFNRIFTAGEQNPNLAEELLVQERPGIIAWMLDGARRLLEQGRYTVPSSSDKAVSEWRRAADQVATFAEEETDPTKDDWERTPGARLYAIFKSWAERNGHRPVSITKFGMRMAALGFGASRTKNGMIYPVRLRADAV